MLRVPLLALLLLTLPFAGCLGDDTGQGGLDQVPALSFQEAQRMPEEHVAAEPNVITGPDGQVWIVAPGSLVDSPNIHQAEVYLWGSTDEGGSWTPLRTTSQAEESPWCSCDADISLGPDGALYLTDFFVNSPGRSSPADVATDTPLPGSTNGFVVQSSSDGGQSWSQGNFVTVGNLVGNDRQYITAGAEPGVVYLSYARGGLSGDQPDTGLHLWRSQDGGQTFSQQTQVVQATAETFPLIAKPRVAADGTVYFPWYEVSSGEPTEGTATVKLGVSTDAGETFEVHDVAQASGWAIWPLQADVGPDGTLHLVWMDRLEDGGSQLKYTHTRGQADSFAPVRTVGWTEGTALVPWITAAGQGRAVVGFYGTPEPVLPMEAPEDTRWDAWALVVEAEGGSSQPTRVSPFPVKVGVMCPNGAGCPHDRELLDYPSVAWGDGWLHMAFAVSTLDEGAGPDGHALAYGDPAEQPEGGHDAAAHIYHARAPLAPP